MHKIILILKLLIVCYCVEVVEFGSFLDGIFDFLYFLPFHFNDFSQVVKQIVEIPDPIFVLLSVVFANLYD